MDDEGFLFGRSERGRAWHIVPTSPSFRGTRARCGFWPLRGFWDLRSSLWADEVLCRRCSERTGPVEVLRQPGPAPRPHAGSTE